MGPGGPGGPRSPGEPWGEMAVSDVTAVGGDGVLAPLHLQGPPRDQPCPPRLLGRAGMVVGGAEEHGSAGDGERTHLLASLAGDARGTR